MRPQRFSHADWTRYYLLYAGLTHDGKQQAVEPFPNGFQMIAGNNFNRNSTLPDPDPNPKGPWPEASQDQRAQRAIGFNCLHYAAGNDEPTLMRHKMPEKAFLDSTCTDGLRLEIAFASCWNGQLDGGPSHKAHVAYPDGVQVGDCPQGYDRRLVTLFFETIVATDQLRGKAGQFVLANGDPTGYGYHGDFIAAWKDDALKKAVNACNQQDSSGMMQTCPVFQMTQDSQQYHFNTPLPASIAKEDVTGPMRGLANGLQVAYGPGPAPNPGNGAAAAPARQQSAAGQQATQNAVPTAPLPAVSAPMGTHSAEPVLGAVHEKLAIKPSFAPVSNAAASFEDKVEVEPVAPPATTPAPSSPPAGALKPGERILGTLYYTQGNQVQEVVEVLEEVTVTPAVVTTVVSEKRAHQQHVRRHMHHQGYVHGAGEGK